MISEKKIKRVELVRALVLETLHTIEKTSKKEGALVNLLEVSSFASLLAIRREQNSEIAAIAGLLHDFYFYKTGIKDFPGPNSADSVRPILRSTQIFTDEGYLSFFDRSFIKMINTGSMDLMKKLLKTPYLYRCMFRIRRIFFLILR